MGIPLGTLPGAEPGEGRGVAAQLVERTLPEDDRPVGRDGVEVVAEELLVELGMEAEDDQWLTHRMGGLEPGQPGEERLAAMRDGYVPAGQFPRLGGDPLARKEQCDQAGVHVGVDQARQDHRIGEALVDHVLVASQPRLE